MELNWTDYVLRAYVARSPKLRASLLRSAKHVLSMEEYESFYARWTQYLVEARGPTQELLGTVSLLERTVAQKLIAHLGMTSESAHDLSPSGPFCLSALGKLAAGAPKKTKLANTFAKSDPRGPILAMHLTKWGLERLEPFRAQYPVAYHYAYGVFTRLPDLRIIDVNPSSHCNRRITRVLDLYYLNEEDIQRPSLYRCGEKTVRLINRLLHSDGLPAIDEPVKDF